MRKTAVLESLKVHKGELEKVLKGELGQELKEEHKEEQEDAAKDGTAPAPATAQARVKHSLEEDSFKTFRKIYVAKSLQNSLGPIKRAGQGAS